MANIMTPVIALKHRTGICMITDGMAVQSMLTPPIVVQEVKESYSKAFEVKMSM
jgi:hypothetical protein